MRRPKSQTEAQIDVMIHKALSKLEKLDPVSEEYGTIIERVSKLHKLKADEKSKHISSDTMLIVAANLFGILWITGYERAGNVISTKAFGHILRPR